MRTWCVGGRAAPPRGGGSLAVCLLRPQVRRRRGTQSCSPWHRLLLGARGELLSKTLHTGIPRYRRCRAANRRYCDVLWDGVPIVAPIARSGQSGDLLCCGAGEADAKSYRKVAAKWCPLGYVPTTDIISALLGFKTLHFPFSLSLSPHSAHPLITPI